MRLPISPITLRIYLVSLLQAALGVAAIVGVVFYALREHPEMHERQITNYVIDEVTRAHEDPGSFEEETKALGRGLHVGIRISDARGVTVFPAPSGLESCWSDPPRQTLEKITADRLCASRSEGAVSIDVVRRRTGITLPQIALMHAVIFAVGSVLLGRSLVGPLRHMSKVARAFGRGDTSARVRLERRDELGDVARAFDEMAEQVVDVRRAERELLANISHELRTPLTRIRLALEFANHEKPEVAFQSQKDIAEDLDELETLVSDILTAARLELEDSSDAKGLSPLKKEPLEVQELIARVESRFRTTHPARKLEVVEQTAHAMVDVDPVQLRRAIDNLLDNAHKYTREADVGIALRAEASADEVTIRVLDRGIGIGADDQTRLFRPFFRVDRSRSRATGGLGLGLLLVRRIVEAHGGRVTIVSAPGKGTEANITLPRRSA